jgi:hypothetical protein
VYVADHTLWFCLAFTRGLYLFVLPESPSLVALRQTQYPLESMPTPWCIMQRSWVVHFSPDQGCTFARLQTSPRVDCCSVNFFSCCIDVVPRRWSHVLSVLHRICVCQCAQMRKQGGQLWAPDPSTDLRAFRTALAGPVPCSRIAASRRLRLPPPATPSRPGACTPRLEE